MINFEKHLKEILYEYDFVVIPNFGAFIANFEVLESNGESHPSKTFSFNRLLNIDENQKFFNYLVKVEKKPISEIQIQWNNYLLNLKNELNKNKRFEIEGLGSVIDSGNGDLSFKFLDNLNFYERDSFESKDEFQASVMVNEPPEEEASKIVLEIPEESAPLATEQLPVEDEIPSLEKETENPPFEELYEEESRNEWKFLIWLLPLLLILAMSYYFWQNRQAKKLDSPSIDSTSFVLDSTQVDSLMDVTAVDSAQISKDSTSEITEPKPQETVESKPKPKAIKYRYHVWAGLFQSKSNADKLKSKLRKGGLKAEIQMVKDMRRVYVPVQTESQAKTTVKKIEQLTGDKAVYFEVD